MKVLLDTHAVIWAVDDPTRFGTATLTTLQDPAAELLVSAASLWEIAIKVQIGKLMLSRPYRDWMIQALYDLQATLLPISIDDCETQIRLPHYHRDPFDRLLVAQALGRRNSHHQS